MAENLKHVVITDELAAVLGKKDESARIYRAEGSHDDYQQWWDTLVKHFPRGLVSPGGASPYAGVSRAAVHKGMREGRLTVFSFNLIEERRGIFGSKLVRTNPYYYLPVIELKAWRGELEERLGRMTQGLDAERAQKLINRELEGERPDWDGWFMIKHPEGRVVKRKSKGVPK